MRFSALAICLLFLSGCALFGSDDGNQPAELVEFEPRVELETLWRESVGSGTHGRVVKLQPALDDEAIYAADADGRVEAFDRHDGTRLWRQKTGYDLTGGVASQAGMVLFGTRNGEVVALDSETGDELWRAPVSSEVVSVPNTNGDTVVALTIDGALVALDAETGEQDWKYETQSPVLTLRGNGMPAMNRSTVFAGFDNGKVIAFDESNGLIEWEHRVALPEGRSELERMIDIDASPLLHNDVLYAASYQGKVTALSRSNGRPLWKENGSTHQDLSIDGRTLFLSEADGRVRALSATSGSLRWENDQLLYRELNGPQTVGDYVAVGDFDGYLHLLDQETGEFVARERLDGAGISSSMKTDGDTLYVLTDGGRLIALRISE